jgi:phosphatidylserine/phosphatidylglycerophosphate/cardiolipin synthase-like enzyme
VNGRLSSIAAGLISNHSSVREGGVNRKAVVGGFVTLLALLAACAPAETTPQQPAPQIEVYFSPKGGYTDAIVRELDAAKESVLVQAYTFTSAPIAEALMEAHKRRVKVQVVLDKSQWTAKYSSATFFQNVGIPTFVDEIHAIARNKVMVIDSKTVITGSFNFTKAAEDSNAENLLVIDDVQIAEKFLFPYLLARRLLTVKVSPGT